MKPIQSDDMPLEFFLEGTICLFSCKFFHEETSEETMANAFEVGDVVILKSGGELMTVESVDGSNISCVWSPSKKVERSTFVALTIKKYEPSYL